MNMRINFYQEVNPFIIDVYYFIGMYYVICYNEYSRKKV